MTYWATRTMPVRPSLPTMRTIRDRTLVRGICGTADGLKITHRRDAAELLLPSQLRRLVACEHDGSLHWASGHRGAQSHRCPGAQLQLHDSCRTRARMPEGERTRTPLHSTHYLAAR